MQPLVTRFPPSPTGFLHIGGARTALFNWLLARQQQGTFVLRIEDTDRARSTQEMTNAILEGMTWLGMDWDQGPYFQSERTDIYNKYVDQLLETGHAYYCQCTPEQVEAMRTKARKEGRKPKYDGTCRERGLGPGPGRVVRFKTPLTGKTIYEDLIKGSVAVDNQELDDFIIRRADGSPIYHMSVVVDDALMKVTHIIRGDDHESNTPKQVLLYKALGFDVPQFGHVPMILGPDKKKLSKRHGATSVMVYRDMGYLPEAMINYLARLGWSHGDQEIFSREELIEHFSTDHLGKSASVFDMDKLNWLNAHYIKEADIDRLAHILAWHFERMGYADLDKDFLKTIIPLYQPRAKTMQEMADQALFFILDAQAIEYDPKAVRKFLKPEHREHLRNLHARFANLPTFDQKSLENVAAAYLEDQNIKFKAIAQPIRVALTGKTVSPGLFETMEALGKEQTLARMKRAMELPEE
ncbi:glutamate--tRNA ligase [Desulfoplanes formicivorans]|uniref:Glutamate--tRNA ligase n=1 Tax=Desulfoplanes formicivorans TaxID=1592317 RepID=A0A194ACR5_9BACT|nr:glutamate--tRNA ligase [Desulfoplanes formicivorans]GAU07902.1 glutamyl-tRNA synthetase [Desulfoplanes formicivorans]